MRFVSPTSLALFGKLFVEDRSVFHSRKRDALKGFPRGRGALLDRHLEQHLTGSCWVAVRRGVRTKIISMDLDAKDEGDPRRSWSAMVARYKKLREVLSPPSLVVRSSATGGIHVYWFLSEEVQTRSAVAALRAYLRTVGIEETPGEYEHKATDTTCLRLPFGAGSVHLDIDTLAPCGVADPLEDLLRTIDADAPRYCARQLHLQPSTATVRRSSTYEARPNERLTSQSQCSEDPSQVPITAYGTFHRTQFALARKHRAAGLTKEECEAAVLHWLLGAGHHHMSHTLEDDRDAAVREVRSTIKCLYDTRWSPVVPTLRRRPLSRREFDLINAAASRLHGKERYRMLEFLFELVAVFKAAGRQDLELPRTYLARFRGAHGGTYQNRVQFASEARLLECDGFYARGVCRKYRLLIELDEEEELGSVDAALQEGDITFLSPYMQRQVLTRAATARGCAKKLRRTSKGREIPSRSRSRSRSRQNRFVDGLPSQEDLAQGDPAVSLEDLASGRALEEAAPASPGMPTPCRLPPCLAGLWAASGDDKTSTSSDCGCPAFRTSRPEDCDLLPLLSREALEATFAAIAARVFAEPQRENTATARAGPREVT